MNPPPTPPINVRFAGLGGTGVIKASDIFADVAFRQGHAVKKAEVHGMSQRGGSVQSDVRFGAEVHSPMIPDGACDFLVVLEPTQVDVVRSALLGRLSRQFNFPEAVWRDSLRTNFAEKLHAANDRAFDLGRGA